MAPWSPLLTPDIYLADPQYIPCGPPCRPPCRHWIWRAVVVLGWHRGPAHQRRRQQLAGAGHRPRSAGQSPNTFSARRRPPDGPIAEREAAARTNHRAGSDRADQS
eukprot:503190-Prorocentrum_minimum.AAC.1